jgi:hypothetical protein
VFHSLLILVFTSVSWTCNNAKFGRTCYTYLQQAGKQACWQIVCLRERESEREKERDSERERERERETAVGGKRKKRET